MEYRNFKESDALRLSEIICDTWGYDKLSKNPEVALLMGKIYLYNCLASQNFNLVAVDNDKPVGIIMGDTKKKRKSYSLSYRLKLIRYYNRMKRYPEGRFILDLFKGFEQLDKEMLEETAKNYEGELVFFVTDKNVRGHHVGSTLYKGFVKECLLHDCTNIFVYTDATCNFGFYEHQGFTRVNQRLHSVYDHQFEFYVYEKELDN